jgi:biopolymer transport protein ExbB
MPRPQRSVLSTILLVAALVAAFIPTPLAAGQPAVGVQPQLAVNVVAQAVPAQANSAAGTNTAPRGFFQIVFSGGWIGFLIILLLIGLSVGGLALAVEQVLTLRQDVLMPPGLGDDVARGLAARDLRAADQACQSNPSVLAFVLRAGMAEVEGGWPAVEKAMEDATAEQAARLLRKVEYLSVLGNIAPMVGLLGTVIGMIFAFQEVADTQGAARAAELASGIYQALVTTVGGLLVAIPSLGAFAVFRNRVDELIAETAYTAQHAMLPIKRAQQPRPAAPPPAAPR